MAKRKRTAAARPAVATPAPPREFVVPPLAAAIAVALIVLLGALARLRLLDLPLERDEGEYAYAGQLLLHGVPPYTLMYGQKFPGIYAAYALIEALFGQTIAGIRIGLILITSATTVLVYFLGARLFGRLAGIAAAAAYTLLALTLGSQGLYAHATHFVVLPAVGAFVLLAARGRWWRPLLAGALLALAVLMKQPGAAFAAFGVLWMLVERRWRDAALTTAGGAVVAAITALALNAAHVFGPFWFWTVRYARAYAGEATWAEGRQYLAQTAKDLVSYTPLLWLVIVAGLILALVDPKTRRRGLVVLGLVAAAFLATAAGLYFRPHYFLLLFPFAALAAGGGIAAAERFAPRWLPIAIFALVLLLSIGKQWPILTEMPPERITRALHGDSPFTEAPAIGEYLRDHTAAEDRIAVFGSEPEIFFYANRKSASGYIYMYPLMEHQPFAQRMQRDMMAEVDRANPKYLLSVSIDYSWLSKPDSDREIFDYAEKKVNAGYQLDGIVDEAPGGTVFVWGAEAERYQPRGKSVIMVFKRR